MNLVYMLSLMNHTFVGGALGAAGWGVAPVGGVAGIQPAPSAPSRANVGPSATLAVLGFALGLAANLPKNRVGFVDFF